MGVSLRTIDLSDDESDKLRSLVIRVHEDCPGQIQSRYISRLEAYADQFPIRLSDTFWANPEPLLLKNVPFFSDVERSKILVLSIGEAIGKCAGYSEYNQSYITDIRPTPFSKESSSGTDLLSMHNDLTFASDDCRPAALALVAHIAKGNVPKTLLAPADEIESLLSDDERAILYEDIFEIRSGGKLRWPCEQVRRIGIFNHDPAGRLRIRMSFDNIRPISDLDESQTRRATAALKRVTEIALEIGRRKGHVIEQGQALLIPNDYALHGRDIFEDPNSERLLFRSYIIKKETAHRQNGNTMLSLRY